MSDSEFSDEKGLLHEQSFNLQLAEALRRSRSRWRNQQDAVQAERTRSQGRIDIYINDKQMPPVAIECAYGGDREQDAIRRLDNDKSLDTALAINIPSFFQSMTENEALTALLRNEELRYAVVQKEGSQRYRFPRVGYLSGSVDEISTLIELSSATKGTIEELASKVALLVDRSATSLRNGFTSQDIEEIAQDIEHNTSLSVFRTVSILWLDALLVQSHLRSCDFHLVGDTIDGVPINGFSVSQFVDAWTKIRSLNWGSIFEPAINALIRAGEISKAATADALQFLVLAVDEIESSRLGSHLEVGAELFPLMLEDRKKVAAFYTTPATAELLSTLLIRQSDNHDWSDSNLLKHCKIADLACGTGTLVRAAYRRLSNLMEVNQIDGFRVENVHRDAMEQAITAADVSPIAAHLTNSSMAMMGYGEPYKDTNIGWVSVGEEPFGTRALGKSTGSLEFLVLDELLDMFGRLGFTTGGNRTRRRSIKAGTGTFDYIVMNPPYSRTRKDQSAFDLAGLSETQRTACQKRWQQLLRKQPAKKTAGMAASFLCLALDKVKLGGRIGFVLPLSAAFDDAWGVTREMLVNEFEEIVAICRAGQNNKQSLSADTHMAEMLLVATRSFPHATKTDSEGIVTCVVLENMPIRSGEAGEYGRSIQRALIEHVGDGQPVYVGETEIGRVIRFRARHQEPWSHLAVLNTDLAVASIALTQGKLLDADESEIQFSVKMSRIGELFEVGPTHDLIGHPDGGDPRGAFTFHKITRPSEVDGPIRSLWQADAKSQSTLLLKATHRGIRYNDNKAHNIRNLRGTIHYGRGVRWTSQKLICASTESSIFGGRAWTTLIHEDEMLKSAFVLWANSTFGMITHWTQGSRTQDGRSSTQVNAISKIPCPRLMDLPAPVLKTAFRAYQKLKNVSLNPACEAHIDEARQEIDDAVIKMLGLPQEKAKTAITRLRNWWCAEPTIHGGKKKAISLLIASGLK